MRTNAIYIRRHLKEQSLSISTPCPNDVNFRRREFIHCDDVSNDTVLRRAVGEEEVGRRPDPREEHTGQQQTVAQGPRLKYEPESTEAREVHTEVYPVRSTRVILQEIINFFSSKVNCPPPLPPAARPSLSQNMILSSQENQMTHPPHESKSEDKENVPPHDPTLPTAVSMLQDFRRKTFVKEEYIMCPPPPPAAKRLAPRNFGELSPGQLHDVADSSVVKNAGEGARVRRSIVDDTLQKKRKTSGSRNSSIEHENVFENGTPVTINKEKKNAILRRSHREENSTGTVLVSRRHLNWFFQLVEDPLLVKFLKVDTCRRYADKYLLAMVFTYFVRANLKCHQYSKENFFAALYLAHDMEEDEEELKYEVFPWALGQRWRKTYPSLLQLRDDIFWSIDCRAVVSKRCCDQVMEMQPEHWLWDRERPAYHGGALREHLKHSKDNGHPRGPDKSPLQCQTCFEQECSNSQNSYLLYLSESDDSTDSFYMDGGETVMHKERDSGFETFLCEQSDTSMNSEPQDSTNCNNLVIAVDKSDTDGQPVSKSNSFDNCCIAGKFEEDITGSNSSSACDVSENDGDMELSKNKLNGIQEILSSQSDTIFASQVSSKPLHI